MVAIDFETILANRSGIVREAVARGGLVAFMREFWHLVDPAISPMFGWHHDALAEHLEAVRTRQIRDLVINVPPGTGKSLTCSVFWPAYVWALEPTEKLICASYDQSLVLRDSKRTLDLVTSPLFESAYCPTVAGGSSVAAQYYQTIQGGARLSITVKGRGVGWHANTAIVDDPLKPNAALSKTEAALTEAREWFDNTLSTRRASGKAFARVVIMQRLHEKDVAQHALDQGFYHLCLPMEYRGQQYSTRPWKDYDQRTEKGELLWPERYPAEEVAEVKKGLGSPENVECQLGQDPTAEGAGIVKRAHVLHWIELPKSGQLIQSWDLGVNATNENHSRVHGSLWLVAGKRCHLIAEALGILLDYPGSKRLYLETQKKDGWRSASIVLVEAKANGAPLLADLKSVDRRMLGVTPKLSKQDRLRVHADHIETGHLLIPPVSHGPWVEEYKQEICKFPRGLHDDRVDTLTQLFDRVFKDGALPKGSVSSALERLQRGR